MSQRSLRLWRLGESRVGGQMFWLFERVRVFSASWVCDFLFPGGGAE